VSIGSKSKQSADRRICAVDERIWVREKQRDVGGSLVGVCVLKLDHAREDDAVRVEESSCASRTLHRLTGDRMSNVPSQFAWKKMDRVESFGLR
jgi:hypothetical protein